MSFATVKMEFTEAVKQSGGLNAFSPDGKLLVWVQGVLLLILEAICVDHRLAVRDVETMNVIKVFQCIDAIQYIEVIEYCCMPSSHYYSGRQTLCLSFVQCSSEPRSRCARRNMMKIITT